MVSLCYAILGFHNFAVIPSSAVKLQRLHTNVLRHNAENSNNRLPATRFRQLLRRIRYACGQLAMKAKITKI